MVSHVVFDGFINPLSIMPLLVYLFETHTYPENLVLVSCYK